MCGIAFVQRCATLCVKRLDHRWLKDPKIAFHIFQGFFPSFSILFAGKKSRMWCDWIWVRQWFLSCLPLSHIVRQIILDMERIDPPALQSFRHIPRWRGGIGNFGGCMHKIYTIWQAFALAAYSKADGRKISEIDSFWKGLFSQFYFSFHSSSLSHMVAISNAVTSNDVEFRSRKDEKNEKRPLLRGATNWRSEKD